MIVLQGKRSYDQSMTNDRKEEINAQKDECVTSLSSSDSSNSQEAPSRRELIERYGKYALVAAPLLLFASKAHAIHSAP
jgi:hypothetical protein